MQRSGKRRVGDQESNTKSTSNGIDNEMAAEVATNGVHSLPDVLTKLDGVHKAALREESGECIE